MSRSYAAGPTEPPLLDETIGFTLRRRRNVTRTATRWWRATRTASHLGESADSGDTPAG
jgi:hypothetical protein